MKKMYALILLTAFLVQCASQPLALENREFSSEASFKIINQINRVIPLIQSGQPTVKKVAEALQERLEYDLTSGTMVARGDGYTVTARFTGELKDEDTVLSQINFNLAPNEVLKYADIQTAFGDDYVTNRQDPVVIHQKLAHANKVEFLLNLQEPATETDQPVKSLLLRPAK